MCRVLEKRLHSLRGEPVEVNQLEQYFSGFSPVSYVTGIGNRSLASIETVHFMCDTPCCTCKRASQEAIRRPVFHVLGETKH